jgi:hypothetical protein
VATELQAIEAKLGDALARIERLEARLSENGSQETAWRYLVARPHSWRRQLSIKGRNMTVGQMMSTIRAEHYTPEQASENLELPLEAIQEALAYYSANRGLIELEALEERRRAMEKGIPLEPADLRR